jgi:hypothetical protein
MADLTQLRTLRAQYAQVLETLDRMIEDEVAATTLNSDEVRRRKLVNAGNYGRTMALSASFSTPSDEAELRRMLDAYYGGDVVQIEAALDGARAMWRNAAAS